MKRTPKEVGASVRDRLLQLARERNEDFQHLLTRYVNERFLFRLASSRHSSRFVLKGAALFTLWTGKPHRATRDLDLLGFGDPRPDQLREVFSEVLMLDFDGEIMARAIRATFERRKTPLPTTLPVAFTPSFTEDPMKKSQWSGFVRKSGVRDASSLADTVMAIAAFVEVPFMAAATGTSANAHWRAGGPWG